MNVTRQVNARKRPNLHTRGDRHSVAANNRELAFKDESLHAATYKTLTASGAANTNDTLILCDATAGAMTVTLPLADSARGHMFIVKKIDASANAVTIDPAGAELIDGAATLALAAQWDVAFIGNNGVAWYVESVKTASSGSGAPTDAEYLVAVAHAGLSAERVTMDTATVTWDHTVAGQAKANVPANVVDPANHATDHQNGGGDEINVAGLSGLLADDQNPTAHKADHENGGADEINVAGLSGELADAQPITIRKNTGADVGTRSRLNFREGTNITLTIADDAGDDEVDITIDASGSASNPVYAPGNFTLATGEFRVQAKTLILTGSQRATLQGTSRLRGI